MENQKNITSSLSSKSLCCGCAACESVCPADAIIMALDECGFYYSRVNLEKCIDCGMCQKVCVFSR